jgi:O-antigen/teichoic acid export membrane protein
MTLGQIFNAAAGLSGIYLNMSRQENISLYISVFYTLSMLILFPLLGDRFGVVGVAWGYSITIILRSVAFVIAAQISLRRLRSEREPAGS